MKAIKCQVVNLAAEKDVTPGFFNLAFFFFNGECMRIYISGPITGTNDYHKRFKNAERILKGAGYEVINPVTICQSRLKNKNASYEDYMRICLTELVTNAEAICLLKGWENSCGALVEKNVAEALNLKKIDLFFTQ